MKPSSPQLKKRGRRKIEAKEKIQPVVETINSNRRKWETYSPHEKRIARQIVSASLYYLPFIASNKRTSKTPTPHHEYSRHQAAEELLNREEDISSEELLKLYKEIYGIIKYISKEEHKTIHRQPKLHGI